MRVRVFISLEIISSAHKTQVEFGSHFSGKKVRLMGREIRYHATTFGFHYPKLYKIHSDYRFIKSCFVHKFHCDKIYVKRTPFIYFCTSSSGKSICLPLMFCVTEFCFTVMHARLSCTSSLLKSFMLRNVFLTVQKRVYVLINSNFCKNGQGREVPGRIFQNWM
jgi:hypothetical protein